MPNLTSYLIAQANTLEEKAEVIQAVIDMLVEQFELQPLKLKLDGRLGKALGKAAFQTDTILINPIIIDTSELEDTIRHEVAHFLAFKRGSFNHNETWKQAAIELGAKPRAIQEFIRDEPKASGFRYRYECGKGCIWYAHRAKRTLERTYTTCQLHHLTLNRITL